MATGAFNTIKSAINAGKDIQSMGTQLGQWGKAMSDLDYAHKKAEQPPMFKKLFGSTAIQQNALEVWGHKQKAKEMREELRSYISALYGPSAWEEIVYMESQMRKQQREAVYAAQEQRERIYQHCSWYCANHCCTWIYVCDCILYWCQSRTLVTCYMRLC